MAKLTALGLKGLPPGKHEDGQGLRFVRRADGAATWVLRFSLHGRRREMGLGRYPDIGLRDARDAAEAARKLVRQGLDPIGQRDARRREEARPSTLLASLAAECFEARKAELKGDGIAGRWFSPLAMHVLPKLGRVQVTDINTQAPPPPPPLPFFPGLLLTPIWQSRPGSCKARPSTSPLPRECSTSELRQRRGGV